MNTCILDTLHEAGIEIVSPAFMNTRVVTGQTFIARGQAATQEGGGETKPESIVFDKAEKAEMIEKMKNKVSLIEMELESLQDKAKNSESEQEKSLLTAESVKLERVRDRLTARVRKCTEEQTET